jgi:transposase
MACCASDKEVTAMRIIAHHSLEELIGIASQERYARRLIRLRIVILAMQDRTAPEIAGALGISRRAAQNWVYRYNTMGLEGLRDRRGGAYRRRLSNEQQERLDEHVRAEAMDPRAGYRRAEGIRCWIEREFNVVYTLSGVYAVLRRLGYSWLMPRPRHNKADLEAQEAFKKTRQRRSNRLVKPTRTSTF